MSNTGILKKAIDELQKESPKLEYVRGILETLYDMASDLPDVSPPVLMVTKGHTVSVVDSEPDEASILDAKARAAIRDVQALSEASKTE